MPNHRVFQAAQGNFDKLFLIVGNAAARAAECVRGANNQRIADFPCKVNRAVNILDYCRFGNRFADSLHKLFKQFAVFGFLNRLNRRAEQFDVVFFQNSALGELHGEIKSCLSAERRK